MGKRKSRLFNLTRMIGRKIYRRRVWLLSDRSIFAGDNGEAFFRYLKANNVDAIFAIKRKSRDYDRVSKIGEIVEYESLKYKFLLCICECHCSSQTIHMRNHTEAPQIFLQHGVAETDISKLLNPISNENFYVITSACNEKESFLGPQYNISSNHVWLTGLPRFDYLKNNPKKLVVIMFTWREKLLGCSENELLKSKYIKTLIEISDDEYLKGFLNSECYELKVMLHPELQFLSDLIKAKTNIRLYEKSYNKLFEEASIVVTDYSSAVYDFVYMYKPIIYYQFDNGEYFNNSFTSRGYFDYQKDGFGPVTKDFESFVMTLKSMINKGCVMDDDYRKRIDDFLEYRDKNNCERVYRKILEIL